MSILNPTRQQFDALLALKTNGPVFMLNLLRFREHADYGDREGIEPCSGREAYQRYGRAIAHILGGVGGRPVWHGTGQLTLIAPEGEAWDECLLVRYPDIEAFQRMLNNPDYQAQTFHRDAALSDSRLIINQSDSDIT